MMEKRRQRGEHAAAARQARGKDALALRNTVGDEEERLRQAEFKAGWVQVG